MSDIEFNCPQCQQPLAIDEAGAGRQMPCPTCGTELTVPQRANAPSGQTPRPAAIASARPASRPVSGLAVGSLVAGILAFCCFGPLAAIPAIICGHVAMSRIRKAQETLSGNGLALAGVILGYVNLACLVVMIPMCSAIAIPSFVQAREASQTAACINNLRMLDAAKEQAALESGWSNDQPILSGSPEEKQVMTYLKGSTLPVCPKQGTYAVNPIGVNPTCSVTRHAMQSAMHADQQL